MSGKIHISASVAETERIAAALVSGFVGGEVVALSGELGVGKTQFVRGMLKGLGGDGRDVSSPTFVLLNWYKSGRLALYHLDAYRVKGSEDFEGIGFAELMEEGGVVAVEWPERVPAVLPAKFWKVTIEAVGESERQIEIVEPDG